MNYWKPKYRYQVIEWLVKRWPSDKAKFCRMGTRQLFAIYHSTQTKHHEKEKTK